MYHQQIRHAKLQAVYATGPEAFKLWTSTLDALQKAARAQAIPAGREVKRIVTVDCPPIPTGWKLFKSGFCAPASNFREYVLIKDGAS